MKEMIEQLLQLARSHEQIAFKFEKPTSMHKSKKHCDRCGRRMPETSIRKEKDLQLLLLMEQ